jgi:hypothetical protein
MGLLVLSRRLRRVQQRYQTHRREGWSAVFKGSARCRWKGDFWRLVPSQTLMLMLISQSPLICSQKGRNRGSLYASRSAISGNGLTINVYCGIATYYCKATSPDRSVIFEEGSPCTLHSQLHPGHNYVDIHLIFTWRLSELSPLFLFAMFPMYLIA